MGVHFYLFSDDVIEVDCPQGPGNAPGQRKALCHAVSDADGMFIFQAIPCGNYLFDSCHPFWLLTFFCGVDSGACSSVLLLQWLIVRSLVYVYCF